MSRQPIPAARSFDRARFSATFSKHARHAALTLGLGALCLGVGACSGSSNNNGGGGGGGSGANAIDTEVSNLSVAGRRRSPARVAFSLREDENDPIPVSFFFRVGTDTFPVTEAGEALVLRLDGGLSSVRHEFQWDFAAEPALGASFAEGVTLIAVLDGDGEAPTLGDASVRIDLGNDAPTFLDENGDGLADGEVPDDEVSGPVEVAVFVADSSADEVAIEPFFAIVEGLDIEGGERPDDGDFLPATGLGPDALAVTTTAGGAQFTFRWDVEADLPGGETEVALRFVADDGVDAGTSPITPRVRVDNNLPPALEIDDAAFAADLDARRGVVIPFSVADPESDTVQVAFQWRRDGEDFPDLPTDPLDVKTALADPLLRAELQLATSAPARAGGTLEVLGAKTVRLPELATTAAHSAVDSLLGRTLTVRRPAGVLADPALRWESNPLLQPVSILPLPGGDSLQALALDRPEVGSWRLVELHLGDGTLRTVASGDHGQPTAMTHGPEGTVLVATSAGNAWSVLSIELVEGEVTVFEPTALPQQLGPVRGLAHLGADRTFVTVADAVLALDSTQPAATEVELLADGLAEPFGIVREPSGRGLWVAESGADRLLRLDPITGAIEPLGSFAGLFGPESLALLPGGGVAVVADADVNDATQELVALSTGGGAGLAARTVGEISGDAGQIAVAADGSWWVAVPSADGLRVRGGIDQQRKIVAHAGGSTELELERALVQPVAPGSTWSLSARSARVASSPSGAPGVFVWDSTDVVGGGDVFLRALAYDKDFGGEDQTLSAKSIERPFGFAPRTIGADVAPETDGLAIVDLDGDGRLDLVGAARSLAGAVDALAVQLQDGAGLFGAGPLVLDPDENAPDAVRAADLNGDGLVDLAYASEASEGILVFLQEPGGTFGPGVAVDEVQLFQATLSVGDVNGDGRADLVATTTSGKLVAVAIFLQPENGFGSDDDIEAVVVELASTMQPRGTLLSDIDADGLVDIGVPSGAGGESALLLFQSSADPLEFESVPLALGGGFDPGAALDSLVCADLDGDGRVEAIAGASLLETVFVFAQTAPRSFVDVAGAETIAAAGLEADTLSALDLDGDGRLDLVAGRANAAPLALLATDTGFDALELDFGADSDSIAFDDVDADGAADVLVADGEAFVLLQNTRARGLGAAQRLALPGAVDPVALIAADLDHDGDLDLAFGGQSVELVEQTAPGVFAECVSIATPGDDVQGLTAADLDGDGALDLVVVTDARADLLRQMPNGMFVPLGAIESDDFDELFAALAADFDGDGRLDLALADRGAGALSVHLQAQDGTFGDASATLQPPSGVVDAAATADLDGDGRFDLIAAGGGPGSVAVFTNGGGTFALDGGALAVPDGIAAIVAADLDGDGDLDLVTGGASERLTLLLQGEGGTFDAPLFTPDASGTSVDALIAVDLDADGHVDLVALGDGVARALYQDALGGFTRHELLGHADLDGPTALAAVDLDGDGEVDVVTANSGSDDLTLFFR